MRRQFFILISLTICLVAPLQTTAQTVSVAEIVVSGNKKTKERIIVRELDFRQGDTLQQELITTHFEQSRNNLLNTSLFTNVQLNIVHWDTDRNEIYVAVEVSESWYIFPVPLFELADRNFNVWWTEQKRSLDRVNIGMRLQILNANGINDAIKLKGQFGYTPKFEATYLAPLINRKQTYGFEINGLYSINKEVAIANRENKLAFVRKDDEVVFRRLRLRTGMTIRPNLYVTHRIRLGYFQHRLDPGLAMEDNPDFFLNGAGRQEYFSLAYRLAYDRRDRSILPTDGWFAGAEVMKEGLGIFDDINAFEFKPFVERAVPLSTSLSFNSALYGKISLSRGKQPYYNYRALGYLADYLRGYELYVVDGLDFVYLKNTFSWLIIDAMIDWKNKMPLRSLRKMPWRGYLTFYYDTGITNDPFYQEQNDFANRWLHGGGIGINVMMYNIFSFQLEFSANHLGEKGVFLHTKTSF